jgi:hypothetical protein
MEKKEFFRYVVVRLNCHTEGTILLPAWLGPREAFQSQGSGVRFLWHP